MQRICRVTVRDLQGITHSTTVTAGSLFEAAAAAVAIFRSEAWAQAALTPQAVLRLEVELPPIVHEVPMKALDRWVNGTSVTPKEMAAKRPLR